MKINFLTSEIAEGTGGFLYDGMLYYKFLNRFGKDVNLIDNSYFGDEFSFMPKKSLQLSASYRKHAKEILDCDYLLVNTSYCRFFMFFPWYLKKQSHCKIISLTHHPDYMEYSGMKQYIWKELMLSVLRNSDNNITPCQYTYDWMGQWDFIQNRMFLDPYLDNTIHVSNVKKEKVICYVGSVEVRKGLEFGIRAFAEFLKTHLDYRFLIAGNFPLDSDYAPFRTYSESLVQLVSDLDISDQVEFLGRIDNEQKEHLFETSQVFLFPSLLEGYGWVIVEAMSYGLPVVAFNNTAMPYTINDTNGILVPNKDIDAMAKGLCRLVDNKELYDQLSSGALKTVQNLPDKETIDQEYVEFLDKIERGTL